MIKSKKIFKFYANIFKQEDIESGFYVEGYASTTGLDRQGDIIVLDALKEAAKDLVNVNNTVFYGHNYDLENAVGRIVEAYVDDLGLRVKIYVSSCATELRTKLKEGIINKFSIGGRVIDDETISKQEAINRGLVDENCPFDQIHIIKKLELYEVSFVGVPANPEAQVLNTFIKALQNLYKGGESMEKKELEKKEEEIKKEEEKVENKEEFKQEEQKQEEEQRQEELKEEQEEHKVEEEKKESEKQELSEEEVKDLLEESKDEDKEDEEEGYYYYYYYGKKISEKLDKLGEAIAEISGKIDALIELIQSKVKTIEITAEKKSVIKKEEKKEEDIDELFFKYITREK